MKQSCLVSFSEGKLTHLLYLGILGLFLSCDHSFWWSHLISMSTYVGLKEEELKGGSDSSYSCWLVWLQPSSFLFSSIQDKANVFIQSNTTTRLIKGLYIEQRYSTVKATNQSAINWLNVVNGKYQVANSRYLGVCSTCMVHKSSFSVFSSSSEDRKQACSWWMLRVQNAPEDLRFRP